MDLIKIGKFIADCRKEKKITQEQLAEQLYITDRAVSKWERGLSLPDADKMLELCNILDINVNELLNGEKIKMKDYNKKTEELLIEMAKQEEKKNKQLMTNMWVLLITDMTFFIGIVLLGIYTLEDGPVLSTIIMADTILAVAIAFYALKLEVEAGYYECGKCHHRFNISYFKALIAPHFSTTRYVRCPKCNKMSWSKKVMTKE